MLVICLSNNIVLRGRGFCTSSIAQITGNVPRLLAGIVVNGMQVKEIKDSQEVLIPNIYKYGTYHNVLDVQVIKSRYHYGWYDNVLDVLVDDTAYFNPQSGCWPTRPEVEWTITATNNRTDLIQYIRYLSYYPGINPWAFPSQLPSC